MENNRRLSLSCPSMNRTRSAINRSTFCTLTSSSAPYRTSKQTSILRAGGWSRSEKCIRRRRRTYYRHRREEEAPPACRAPRRPPVADGEVVPDGWILPGRGVQLRTMSVRYFLCPRICGRVDIDPHRFLSYKLRRVEL